MSNDRESNKALKLLASMRGGGSADEWMNEGVGQVVLEVLRSSDDAHGLAAAWVRDNDFRPGAHELANLETNRNRASQPAKPMGCPDCVGGFRTVRTLRRQGNGSILVRETCVACDCERGESIAQGPPGKGRTGPFPLVVMTWRQAQEELRREPMVTRSSGDPGLLAWGITDRSWRIWGPDMRADEPRPRRAEVVEPVRDEPDYFARMEPGGDWGQA